MKTNQKGFSLIELVVAISLLVVVATVVTFGMGMVSGKPAQQMSKKVESMLQKNRQVSLAKNQASIVLAKNANGWYVQETIDGEVGAIVPVGDASVEAYEVSETGEVAIPNTGVSFEFNRSDGSLFKYKGNPITKDLILKFKRASTTYVLKIVRLTGKMNVVME